MLEQQAVRRIAARIYRAMIDFFCRWTDEAAAKQDARRLSRYLGVDDGSIVKEWYLHQFLPNVKAWRPSQDFSSPPDPTILHTYLAGWMGILALDYIEPVIINDNSLQFALDRNGPPYVIKNNIGGIINDVAVSPIFAGSHYPLGGIS
jgi:hypothetical protein